LVQIGQQNNSPNFSRFRVSRDSIADSLILISQWANYPEVPQPLPAFEVPNGFRVIETESGRLYIQVSNKRKYL
jgi:hypothetical protein